MKPGRLSWLFILSVSTLVFGSTAESKTLRVGLVFNFSDDYNETNNLMGQGFELARLLFQKRHPGVKVEFRRFEHTTPLETVLAATEKVIQANIPAVIGGENSEESFILRDRLGPKKIVFITPTSSNPAVTEGSPYAFRACFSDRIVADRMADFTFERLKPTVIGVLHNVSSPYTDYLSKQFMLRFTERAGNSVPVIDEKILRDAVNFDAQIDRFMAQHVTLVSAFIHEGDFFKFVVEAGQKGFFPTYIGSDGWGRNDNIYELLVRKSKVGDRFIAYRNYYWNDVLGGGFKKELVALSQAKLKRDPDAWIAVAFDTAWVLLLAMDRAKNPQLGESIREALKNLPPTPLLTTSHFSFGPDNSPKKDLFIYKIDKNGVKYEATLQ